MWVRSSTRMPCSGPRRSRSALLRPQRGSQAHSPLNSGLALVEVCIKPRLEILTTEDFRIPGSAGRDRGGGRRHCFDELLGRLDGQRRIGRQRRRQFFDPLLELPRLDDLIDDPIARASSAPMRLPVINSHFALAGPTSCTRRNVSGTGAMKPNRATGMPNFAVRTAMRKSQEAATIVPLPDRMTLDHRDDRLRRFPQCRLQLPAAAS